MDQALQAQETAPLVHEGTMTFYQVDPVNKGEDMTAQDGQEGVENLRGVYPAIVSNNAAPSVPTLAGADPTKKHQYQYKSKCDDSSAVQRVFEKLMPAKVDVSTGELMALSLDFRKYTVDFCKVNRMAAYSLSPQLPAALPTTTSLLVVMNLF